MNTVSMDIIEEHKVDQEEEKRVRHWRHWSPLRQPTSHRQFLPKPRARWALSSDNDAMIMIISVTF